MYEAIAKRRSTQAAPLQVIEGGRKRARVTTQATCLNQHIKSSIYRVVFESDLNVTTLRQVARMFAMPEPQVLDVIRDTVRGRILPPPPATQRKAA